MVVLSTLDWGVDLAKHAIDSVSPTSEPNLVSPAPEPGSI